MPEEEKKNKGGRPPTKLDIETFEGLCRIQCTKEEMCEVFGITDKTLENWVKRNYEGAGFSEVFGKKRAAGKVSLRRYQFNLAKRNAAMAIFLGKNILGQSDKPGGDNTEREDDGFLKALKEEAGGAWQE